MTPKEVEERLKKAVAGEEEREGGRKKGREG